MRPTHVFLSALMVAALQPAWAGNSIADVGIEVAVEPQVTTPGTEGWAIITITNHGPDTGSAIFNWSATFNGAQNSYPPLEFPGPFEGPCGISPIGQPPPGDLFGFWVTRNLAPSESRTCRFGFRVLESTIAGQIARWEVHAIFPADKDPNLSNNESELFLQFALNPDPISVPALSVSRLLLLGLVLGWFACRMNYRVLNRL